MIKWKCSVCLAKRESEVKPVLYQRLCEDCKVSHYTNLVGIYKYSGDDGFRQEEARLLTERAITREKEKQEVAQAMLGRYLMPARGCPWR